MDVIIAAVRENRWICEKHLVKLKLQCDVHTSTAYDVNQRGRVFFPCFGALIGKEQACEDKQREGWGQQQHDSLEIPNRFMVSTGQVFTHSPPPPSPSPSSSPSSSTLLVNESPSRNPPHIT